LVQKTKKNYFLLEFSQCVSTITSFDLWMSKGAYDIFALVINFLDGNWKPRKVTIGLFETTETTSQTLARNLNELLDSYNLKKKIITYVKDEGANLNAMTMALKTIMISWEWKKVSMEHVFSKTYQYATTEKRVCKNLKFVSIKSVQSNI
jgi:hypothetical protein